MRYENGVDINRTVDVNAVHLASVSIRVSNIC